MNKTIGQLTVQDDYEDFAEDDISDVPAPAGMHIKKIGMLNAIKRITKRKPIFLMWYDGNVPELFPLDLDSIKFNAWTTNMAEQIKIYINKQITNIRKNNPILPVYFVELDEETFDILHDILV